MTMRRNLLHGIIFTSLLAASGCGSFAAGGDPLHGARGAAWDLDAGARPVPGRAGLRAEPVAVPGIGMGHGPEAGARFIAPAETIDSVDLRPGALLDVWLNDEDADLRTLSGERSLGTAVVRGDFFRYNTVNSDPDLRGFWGRPLLLKWSAILEITERGAHVFVSELSKEASYGARWRCRRW